MRTNVSHRAPSQGWMEAQNLGQKDSLSLPSQRQTDGQTVKAGHREDREMDWDKLKRKQADKTGRLPAPLSVPSSPPNTYASSRPRSDAQRTNRSGWGRPGVEVSTLLTPSQVPSASFSCLALLPPTLTPKESRPCWVSTSVTFQARNTKLSTCYVPQKLPH